MGYTSTPKFFAKQVCEPYFSKIQYDWEHWLHMVSVGILGIFALQLLLLMLIYQKKFFFSAAYVIDTVVVGAALALENMSAAKEGGLFVALLFWRVLRIVHGIASSVEINTTLKNNAANETGAEIANKHAEGTAELHKQILFKIPVIALDKMKAQKELEGNTAKDADQAQKFVDLCELMQSLNTELHKLQNTIEGDKEEFLKESMHLEDKLKSSKKSSLDKGPPNKKVVPTVDTLGGPPSTLLSEDFGSKDGFAVTPKKLKPMA